MTQFSKDELNDLADALDSQVEKLMKQRNPRLRDHEFNARMEEWKALRDKVYALIKVAE